MFTEEMFFDEQRVHGQFGVHTESDVSHFGHLFHDNGIVNGIVGVLAPRKGTVVLHQYRGTWFGFMPLKRSMMTVPVSFSYSVISASVMERVQGISWLK